MAVKPAPGETVVQEVRTRVEQPKITPGKDPELPTQGEFMDWIAALPQSDWDRWQLSVRLWRGTSTKGAFCELVTSPPFSIDWVQRKYGGGDYYYMGYENKMVRWSGTFPIFGKPKEPDEVVTAAAAAAPASSSNETVGVLRELTSMLVAELRASRGGDVATQALRDSMSLGTEVLRTTVPAVQGIVSAAANGGHGNAPVPRDPLMEQFLQAAISKMLNPADPIETFAKMADAMKGFLGGNAGHTSVVQDLIRVLPVVVDKIQAGMANVAQMREQELRAMAMRGAPALPAAPPAAAAPAASTIEAQAPPKPNPAAPAPQSMDLVTFVEAGIVRVLANPDKPVGDAAYEALVLMDVWVPEWVNAMIQGGEDEVMKLFQTRPILQQVPQNPRLAEFVKRFLQAARDSREPAKDQAQTDQTPQPVA